MHYGLRCPHCATPLREPYGLYRQLLCYGCAAALRVEIVNSRDTVVTVLAPFFTTLARLREQEPPWPRPCGETVFDD